MDIKSTLVVISLLVFGAAGLAEPPETFKIPQGPAADLIKETETLKLQDEASVQKLNPSSTSFITVLAGVVHPNFLSIQSYGNTVNYNFGNELPLATAQFAHYLLDKSWGKLGWQASIGYSYSQYDGGNETALHLVPVNASAIYRGEFKSTQKFIPYAALGPSFWSYFQRGLDEYNTSGSAWLGSATVGLAFNLNHLGLISSRNDAEVVLQYQRNISASNSQYDFNGDTFQLGGSLAL